MHLMLCGVGSCLSNRWLALRLLGGAAWNFTAAS